VLGLLSPARAGRSGIFSAREREVWWATPPEASTVEWPSPGIACLAITPTFWDTEMADWHENYNATPAPLVVGDLVISGTAGGDEGARGLVAAFNQSSGKEVWRFWTVPRRGEPGVETWKRAEVEHPGAVTSSIPAQLHG